MRTTRWMTVLAAAGIGLTACEDGDAAGGILVLDATEEELAGLWTGTEEISGEGGLATGHSGGGAVEGFTFPVSLVLRADRTFTLRSFGYPVEGNGGANEPCAGVYEADYRTLRFFPNADCRALPLYRYTIGRFVPDGLTLRAETGRTGGGFSDAGSASIRVLIRVVRD